MLCLLIAIGVIGFGGGNIEERSTQRELVSSVPIRKQSVVADAMKAIRQDMEQEAAHELPNSQPHHLILVVAVVPVILPAKADMRVCEFEQPTVADGDTMGVARKISQELLRACERTLGENHPFLHAQGSEAGLECLPVFKRNEIGEELQLASFVCWHETFEE